MKPAKIEPEDHPGGARRPPQAPDEQDPDSDEAHARGLIHGRGGTQHRDPHQEHEDRRRAPGDRIDDRELGAAVGRRQEGDVAQLKKGCHDEVGDRRPPQMPGQCRDRRIEHEREKEHDRGRGLRVSRPCQEQVPEGVQERRGDRKGEGDGGHGQ